MRLSWMIAAEWVKLRTVRATALLPVSVVVAVIGIAVLVGVTESLQPDDTIVGGSLSAGGTLGLLLAGVFGVLATASEYRSGMMASTLLACPVRWRVLAAKTTVVAVVLATVGVVAGVAAIVVGRLLLGDGGYGSGDAAPAVVGFSLVLALVGMLGVAIGTFIRHPAGAVAAVLGVPLAPTLLAPLLGDVHRWVAGASPTGVLLKVAQSSDAVPVAVGSLGAWPSFACLASYAGIVLGLAALTLERRDA